MILKEQKFHAIQWEPDWSRERYSLIGGQKIPDSVEVSHNSLFDESFTFTHLKNNRNVWRDIRILHCITYLAAF